MIKLKKVFCKNCKKQIYRDIGRYNENLKLGWNFYCSRKCEYQYKTKKQKMICGYCSKKFERTPSAISPNNYCSSSCAATKNNVIAPKRKAEPKICAYKKCRRWFRGPNKYCSGQCGKRGRKPYTPEQLIELLKRTASEMQRTPAKRDVRTLAERCIKTFGTWNKAILTAHLSPNRSHDHRMYKRMLTKADDGHICDSASEAVIDNLLYANGILHKHYYRYPEGNYKADWAVPVSGKMVFLEYFGLANDSPRYDRSVKKKQLLCRKYNIKLVEIYPSDLYPKMQIENKLKGMLSPKASLSKQEDRVF